MIEEHLSEVETLGAVAKQPKNSEPTTQIVIWNIPELHKHDSKATGRISSLCHSRCHTRRLIVAARLVVVLPHIFHRHRHRRHPCLLPQTANHPRDSGNNCRFDASRTTLETIRTRVATVVILCFPQPSKLLPLWEDGATERPCSTIHIPELLANPCRPRTFATA